MLIGPNLYHAVIPLIVDPKTNSPASKIIQIIYDKNEILSKKLGFKNIIGIPIKRQKIKNQNCFPIELFMS
tara:strand:- start:124 stop:336 length:213 start_codon:yes stop_codon:yes gene_type:complete